MPPNPFLGLASLQGPGLSGLLGLSTNKGFVGQELLACLSCGSPASFVISLIHEKRRVATSGFGCTDRALLALQIS